MPVASSTFWSAGPAPPGPPRLVAVQAGGRVIDRPQAVAAVAAGVVGQPLPGEEIPPQRDRTSPAGGFPGSTAGLAGRDRGSRSIEALGGGSAPDIRRPSAARTALLPAESPRPGCGRRCPASSDSRAAPGRAGAPRPVSTVQTAVEASASAPCLLPPPASGPDHRASCRSYGLRSLTPTATSNPSADADTRPSSPASIHHRALERVARKALRLASAPYRRRTCRSAVVPGAFNMIVAPHPGHSHLRYRRAPGPRLGPFGKTSPLRDRQRPGERGSIRLSLWLSRPIPASIQPRLSGSVPRSCPCRRIRRVGATHRACQGVPGGLHPPYLNRLSTAEEARANRGQEGQRRRAWVGRQGVLSARDREYRPIEKGFDSFVLARILHPRHSPTPAGSAEQTDPRSTNDRRNVVSTDAIATDGYDPAHKDAATASGRGC